MRCSAILNRTIVDTAARRQAGAKDLVSRASNGGDRVAVLPDDVRIHDIRQTVADAFLNRIDTPPWIVDHVVLGHARPRLLRTYMPTLPLGEAREALQRWGNELDGIPRRPDQPLSAQMLE